ncbi:hypothetical protein NL676_006928 [Syzygium grande]|nr:hypothetical protein NL676_006928 [Syzygium grande]
MAKKARNKKKKIGRWSHPTALFLYLLLGFLPNYYWQSQAAKFSNRVCFNRYRRSTTVYHPKASKKSLQIFGWRKLEAILLVLQR